MFLIHLLICYFYLLSIKMLLSVVGDCQDALNYFHPASGIYAINIPPLTQPFDVYCDMDGSFGWTVIQVTYYSIRSCQ